MDNTARVKENYSDVKNTFESNKKLLEKLTDGTEE